MLIAFACEQLKAIDELKEQQKKGAVLNSTLQSNSCTISHYSPASIRAYILNFSILKVARCSGASYVYWRPGGARIATTNRCTINLK